MELEITLPYKFIPRPYQLDMWMYMQGQEEGKRACLVWHRRAGKDLTAIHLCAVKAFQRVGTYWHLLPTYKQGRNIVWNGMTRDGTRFIDAFPKELVEDMNSTEMRVKLVNGSIYQIVGSDNFDSLMGTNPVGVVFSEYSLQDPLAWDYIRPILAENGGWAVFIYTARGHNHGYTLRNMAKKNPQWFFSELTIADTKAVPLTIIDEERASGMPEELIQQEYFCSFEAPLVGSYFGSQMIALAKTGQITKVPYEPSLLVNTYWDLGVRDATSIWFVQEHGQENRFIDYYEETGEGLPHYASILEKKGYNYGRHYGPHDIQIKELGTGQTRIETARKLGIRFIPISSYTDEDGIDAARRVLPTCWFDEEKCQRGIEALRSFRKEVISEKRWHSKDEPVYSDRPLHDWASHGASAFRTFAMSRRVKKLDRRKPQRKAIDNYQYV